MAELRGALQAARGRMDWLEAATPQPPDLTPQLASTSAATGPTAVAPPSTSPQALTDAAVAAAPVAASTASELAAGQGQQQPDSRKPSRDGRSGWDSGGDTDPGPATPALLPVAAPAFTDSVTSSGSQHDALEGPSGTLAGTAPSAVSPQLSTAAGAPPGSPGRVHPLLAPLQARIFSAHRVNTMKPRSRCSCRVQASSGATPAQTQRTIARSLRPSTCQTVLSTQPLQQGIQSKHCEPELIVVLLIAWPKVGLSSPQELAAMLRSRAAAAAGLATVLHTSAAAAGSGCGSRTTADCAMSTPVMLASERAASPNELLHSRLRHITFVRAPVR